MLLFGLSRAVFGEAFGWARHPSGVPPYTVLVPQTKPIDPSNVHSVQLAHMSSNVPSSQFIHRYLTSSNSLGIHNSERRTYSQSSLRPWVDIHTRVNDESSIWRGWILNLAACLADDVFAYYVSQQKIGQEIMQAVLDRYFLGLIIPILMVIFRSSLRAFPQGEPLSFRSQSIIQSF